MSRLALTVFPRLRQIRNPEIRNAEAGQPGFRLRTLPGRSFVPDFATGPGRGAGKRCNCGRVVVCFDFHQNVDRFLMEPIALRIATGEKSLGRVALHHGCIVRIGGQHPIRGLFMTDPNHAEQRPLLRLSVNRPVSIEYLVPAMLGIRLREHHQFNVIRIPVELCEACRQIVHLIFSQSQPPLSVGPAKCRLTCPEQVN